MLPAYGTPESNVESFAIQDGDNSTSSKHHYI